MADGHVRVYDSDNPVANFEQKATGARESIKKIVDSKVLVAQNNRRTVKLIFELNIRDGGLANVNVTEVNSIKV